MHRTAEYTDTADVVVVGARCAGAATAMLLARGGHRVVVLEKATFPRDTLSTHGLARGAVVQLARWGLLDDVLAAGAPAARQVTITTADTELVRPIRHRSGVDLLVAPRRHVLDSLLAAAAAEAGADIRFGSSVVGVLRDRGGAVAGVHGTGPDGPFTVRASLVVGADGLRSRMATAFGATTLESHPRDSGLFYAYVDGLDAPGYELHLGDRALAGLFPTNDGQSCVWLAARTSRLAGITTAGNRRYAALVAGLREITPAFGERVRRGTPGSAVRGVSRLPNIIRQAAGPGWALVGDAGYHRDPVTGHGITDAFRDAEWLALDADAQLRHPVGPIDAVDYADLRTLHLQEIFRLTCALAEYPPIERFAGLQRRLASALDDEAELLAAQSVPTLLAS